MAIYIVFFIMEALILGIGFLLGFKRGTGKSVIRLVELIIAAIASLLLGKWISELISAELTNVLYTNIDETFRELLESAPEATELVAGLVGALIFPVLFSVIFLLLELISLIGLSALTKLIAPHFGEKIPPQKSSKWIGAGVGTVSALVVAAIALCPWYTGLRIIANIPSETISKFSEELRMGKDTFAFLPNEDLTPPISSLVVNAATSFNADESRFNAANETPRLATLAGDVFISYSESKEKGEASLMNVSAAISASVSHLKDSEYISRLTTSLLNAIGESIKSGNDIFGITKGQSGAMSDMILSSVGDILTGVTPENISDNIAAIAGDGESEGVLTVITEITSSDTDIKEILEDTEKVDKLASSLINIAENPNLSSTMDALTEMGTGMVAEVLPEEGSQKREEYISKVSESLNEVLNATKETQDNFEESVNTATEIIQQKISEVSDKEISVGEAKIIAICALHNFGTAENYANAENLPISIEDIENFFAPKK